MKLKEALRDAFDHVERMDRAEVGAKDRNDTDGAIIAVRVDGRLRVHVVGSVNTVSDLTAHIAELLTATL